MSNPSLLQQIRALSTALAQVHTADEETRAALLDLQSKIGRVVEHHDDASVTERLEELAVRFETDHPAAGTALRQAIDALSRAGI